MKKLIILSLILFGASHAFAQQNINVAGIVMDEAGNELIGVTVRVKDHPTVGMVTDRDGRFRLSIPANSTLVFSYIGYVSFEKKYGTSDQERESIGLKEDVQMVDEVVVIGHDVQRKVSVVGAITHVDPATLQIPASSISNILLGRVPGIIGVTRSGEPGNNFSEFWIRGISTFGASQSALVLIDGVEGRINDLDPEDIESFSILKDASATAVYGVRGANGVIVVTTKRGKAGSLKINFKANATYSYSPIMPEYVDAYNYVLLANEARMVRGYDPAYTDTELLLYKYNLDPDLYPNVNWRDEILKDHIINPSFHASISGGGTTARYYLSLGLSQNESLFKQDKNISERSTNIFYNKYNFRANIDANVTRSTMIGLNLETVFTSQNAPGGGWGNTALWEAQALLPANLVPVRYSNGQLPVYGTSLEQRSPYVRLNYFGSTNTERYTAKVNLNLHQDLGMIVPGLSASGMFSLTTNGTHVISMTKNPDMFYASPSDGRNLDGTLRTSLRTSKGTLTTSQTSSSDRSYYFEAKANYNQVFSKDHRVTGLLLYYQQEIKNSTWTYTAVPQLAAFPQRYMALSGRATYSFKDTYLIEGNLGYTGSENFNKGRRFGLFPSIAVGWIPSQYKAFQSAIPFINYLKFRASYGEVGNDRLSDGGSNIRFPYLTLIGNVGSGTWGGTGIGETTTGATNMEWETTHKYNFGIDAHLFKDRVDFTLDFFRNKTTGIFQRRANIPDEVGMTSVLPYSNIGAMTAWGADGTLAYTQRFNSNLSLTGRANITLSRNKVNYWERSFVYPYQSWSGVPYGVLRGLIALGLFKNEQDILSSPTQTFMSDVRPGDIKYKDVNNDGEINDDDIVPLSFSNIPNFQYGFALEGSWKNLTVSAFFEGVREVEFFHGGYGYYPFAQAEVGNLLTMVQDPKNRWIPADYAAEHGIDPALAENPNAKFPRLTYGNNANNNRSSSFWLTDGSYIRFKNLQVAYRLPKPLISRLRLESVTVSLIGDNLHVWSKDNDLFDPTQASSNGAAYPVQRMFTGQLNITF
jgi:TonB-linked SusC/RagA family outer membrane protein